MPMVPAASVPGSDGVIDDQRWDVLAAREQQLARLISQLVGYEASYCQRLLGMTVLVLHPPDAQ